MGTRVLNCSRAHPDPSAGYAAAPSRLEERLVQAEQLADQQRAGLIGVRTATAKKRDLRRTMRRTQLVHLARVAEAAESESPSMERKFLLPEGSNAPYLAFRTAARGMAAEALTHKELLIKHGLVDSVLDSLAQSLADFDQAIEQGTEARHLHVAASAELDTAAEEVSQVARVMDGQNRYRFANDRDALIEWESSSNTVGPFRQSVVKPEPPATGAIAPAA
jgi:hypothetical protein